MLGSVSISHAESMSGLGQRANYKPCPCFTLFSLKLDHIFQKEGMKELKEFLSKNFILFYPRLEDLKLKLFNRNKNKGIFSSKLRNTESLV